MPQPHRRIAALLAATLLLAASDSHAQTSTPAPSIPAIIPLPASIESHAGAFQINAQTVIFTDDASVTAAHDLAWYLAAPTGWNLAIRHGHSTPNSIEIRTDATLRSLGAEGYKLDVQPDRIAITAPAAAGLFYATQTLRQLLPPQIFSTKAVAAAWTVPCVTITDQPRFAWRGLALDCSRHFIKAENVKRMIDLMSIHKMNVLHWHLTDDQGWRIEIKKYPRLTSAGSIRASSPPMGNRGGSDGKQYGGFYTQDQVRDIVAFARARHVTIIPEIEMPGHAAAAMTAYPEFGNKDVPGYHPEVWTHFGISDYVFSPSDETFAFLAEILGEVAALFPDSPFIHIGGDECPRSQWNSSAAVKKAMQEHGLKNGDEVQNYFTTRVEKIVNGLGKRIIGWDDIEGGHLAPSSAVMVWHNYSAAINAATHGHDVVMALTSNCYFDYGQGPSPGTPAFEVIGGNLPLDHVYDFDPVPRELTPEQRKHVLGTEAELWSEYAFNQAKVEYMAFPRLCALSEVAWSPQEIRKKEGFMDRLNTHEARLDALKVNYRKSDGSPAQPNLPIQVE